MDLAKSTVKDITDDLIRDHLVDELQIAEPVRRQGRPPKLLKISTDRGHLIAVDVGAEKVIVRVTALSGDTIAQQEHHFGPFAPQQTDVFRALRELTDQVRSEARTDAVLAVAVGTPGVVNPHDGSVALAPQIEGWNGLRLDQEVATMMSVPRERIVVERQADLAAVAEGRVGAAQGAASVLYVHLGVGLGSAILLDGHLYRGHGGAAGEIGYLPHHFDEEVPVDSEMGSWEWAAGGLAFARHGQAAARGAQGSMLRELAGGDPDAVDARVVFAADSAGDQVASEIVDRLTKRLAIGIASGICVLAPDRVILAGGLSRAGDRLLQPLERALRGLVPVMPELRVSRFGAEGVVTGAVFRAAQHALDLIGAE